MKMRKCGTEKMRKCICLLSVVLCLAASASHISETLTLAKGWNAIYLESTPDDANCEAFFADVPAVTTVLAYLSDAYASTRQYADDGSEILQKPVSYLTWNRGDTTGSTLGFLGGGHCYLVYATAAATKTFLGVPSAPAMTWRDTTKGDFMNLVGVTLQPGAQVLAAKYFGEGPYGNGTLYQVSGGTGEVPNFKSVAFMGQPKVASGKAYGASAAASGAWGGVIGFVGSAAVPFGADQSQSSVEVKNAGTVERTFRFTLAASEKTGEEFPALKRRLPRTDALLDYGWSNAVAGTTWEVTLAPGKSAAQVFSVDRLAMDAAKAYGAVLVVDDLSGTQMRVRVPVTVAKASESAEKVKFPVGLWCGTIQLAAVSQLTNQTPVAAGGLLKMSVMMHVDEDGKCTLLQRVAAGVDTNGTARLFRDLADVPSAEVEGAKRFSTGLMSVDTPVVAAADGSAFGDDADFSWVVGPKARDNPFRHAWHPDHDGKKADYSGDLPAGDDFSLYANPVKPELWSISNRLEFSWHEQGNRALPAHFTYNADETTSGIVSWEVSGLLANRPIKSVGTFTLKRVFKARKVEE